MVRTLHALGLTLFVDAHASIRLPSTDTRNRPMGRLLPKADMMQSCGTNAMIFFSSGLTLEFTIPQHDIDEEEHA